MSATSALHALVHSKFREAFGEPNRVEGADYHWSLRHLRYSAAIHVLVNSGGDHPVVWIFDPHMPNDGVSHQYIRREAEINDLIARITARVRAAGQPGPC